METVPYFFVNDLHACYIRANCDHQLLFRVVADKTGNPHSRANCDRETVLQYRIFDCAEAPVLRSFFIPIGKSVQKYYWNRFPRRLLSIPDKTDTIMTVGRCLLPFCDWKFWCERVVFFLCTYGSRRLYATPKLDKCGLCSFFRRVISMSWSCLKRL